MARYRGRNPSAPLTKEQRLEQLKQKFHVKVLERLLSKQKPLATDAEIESHRGRRNKAVNDLTKAGHIKYQGTNRCGDRYYSEYDRVFGPTGTFDACVQEYAAKAQSLGENRVGRHVAQALSYNPGCDRQYGNIHHNLYAQRNEGFGRVGMTEIRGCSLPELADAWLHRDGYLFWDDKSELPGLWEDCPKPHSFIEKEGLERLPKLLLRNAVEHYASVMNDLLAAKISKAGCGIASSRTVMLTINNIGKYPPTPANVGAVLDQCDHAFEALKRYRKACERMAKGAGAVCAAGRWQEEGARLAIQEILTAAPAVMCADDVRAHPSMGRMNNIRNLTRYVMEHSGIMSYEALFDDRSPSWVVANNHYGQNEDSVPEATWVLNDDLASIVGMGRSPGSKPDGTEDDM